MGIKIVSSLLSVLILNVLWATRTGYAAPLLDAEDPRDAPVTKCSLDGQCWKRLPTLEMHDDTVLVINEDGDTSKLQSRRQVTSPASELAWQDDKLAGQIIRPPSPTKKQMPFRITKKDVLGARSRGAGGMPFSVLYMNPHHSRSSAVTTKSTTQRPETSATTRNSNLSPAERPSYQRKRQPTVPPRRQFMTIPQLFISYGWDAYGK